ncbi:MAG: VapC toxin family PIN domain ribonuclease, partial [Betaproteobacteria bacterium]|nr:VapC toxin family PIN domain ribonuclease [Betaproteobacteria bacterium]
MSLVLDNSVAMLWLLPQSNPAGMALADKVLTQLQNDGAMAPSLWTLEAANVIAKCQRLGKITQAQASAFVALLEGLGIAIDTSTSQRALHDTLDLARQFRLSAYDAAYLELALR